MHHKSGRVHVEAVNDAQTIFLALDIAKVICAVTIDERVHKRTVAMVVGRMAYKSSLLRQHDHIVVFVADIQIYRLANKRSVNYLLFDFIDDCNARMNL